MTLKDMLIAGKLAGGNGGGGGPTPGTDDVDLKDVVFIDYDGEVVYNYTAAEFLSLNAMPANPSHNGLVAQGWNWSLADAKAYVQENGILVVGQNYTTDNGNTKIYLHVSEFLLENKIRVNIKPIAVANGVTIHWGDGTTTTTNSKNATNYDHQYSEAGDYVIELESTNGKYTLGDTMNSFLGGATLYNVAPIRFIGVKKIEFGSNIYQIERRACNDLMVTTISVPADIEKMTGDSYRDSYNNCYYLKALVVPEGAYLAQSGDHLCNNARSLKFISLPKTQPSKLSDGNLSALRMLSMPASGTAQTRTGYNALQLEKISLPGTYTNIPDNLLRYSSIKKFTIPETVTSINASSINELPNIREYHFKSATPPTLASSNNMFSVNSDVKIYVPYSADHSILNAYKTATNWSGYANYIEEESE